MKASVRHEELRSISVLGFGPRAALVLLAAAMATSQANAQNALEPPRAGTSPVVNKAEVADIASYWTPERLSSAQPMDLIPVDSNVAPSPTREPEKGPAGFVEGQPPIAKLPADASEQLLQALGEQAPLLAPGFNYVYPFSTYADADYNMYPDQTIGRLFFTLDGVNYSCSASVIRPHTLVTARHCVYNYGNGHWATNEVFYPALYNGFSNGKYGGAWYGRRSATWVSGAATLDYDIGFIQLFDHNHSGCGGSSNTPPIESYTGYLGYTYNGDFSQRQWAIFGYPAATNSVDHNPFNGNWMIRSDAATGQVASFGYTNTTEVGSDQTGGTSGGPWIIGYSPAVNSTFCANNTYPGTGTHGGCDYVNSVNSFKFTNPDHSLAINGPQFQTYNFLNLLSFYNTLSCP